MTGIKKIYKKNNIYIYIFIWWLILHLEKWLVEEGVPPVPRFLCPQLQTVWPHPCPPVSCTGAAYSLSSSCSTGSTTRSRSPSGNMSSPYRLMNGKMNFSLPSLISLSSLVGETLLWRLITPRGQSTKLNSIKIATKLYYWIPELKSTCVSVPRSKWQYFNHS